ncbi:hypothetical protein DITRI_Ditri01bG0148100 [Diplodiscus trichospermus]
MCSNYEEAYKDRSSSMKKHANIVAPCLKKHTKLRNLVHKEEFANLGAHIILGETHLFASLETLFISPNIGNMLKMSCIIAATDAIEGMIIDNKGFQPGNLVALVLPYSRIEQLRKGNRPLHKLKLVNLRGSQNLIKTPNFALVPNLERLILEGCTRMVDVHPSIGVLRNLKLLNLRNCKSLKRFPEIEGGMECLLELYLDGTSIEELPSSIGHLSNLVSLSLKDCDNLVSLPSSIDWCKCLKLLNLSGCSKVETLPGNLEQVKLLEDLDLSETSIRKPPSSIFQFKNLKVLSFNGCKGPPSKLQPKFPSLFKLLHGGSLASMALMLPPLSNLSSLTNLNLSDCNLWEGAIPGDICSLSCLETLNLCGNNFMSLPTTLARLSGLRRLLLSDCKWLKSVPELLTSVEGVCIDGCTSLEVFANPKSVCDSSIDRPFLIGTNCYRSWKNSNSLTIQHKFLKVFANAPLFDIIIPGSEIPEWFGHQSDGCSIKISLPYNLRNDNQWMGVAFCFTFVSSFTDDDDACTRDRIMCKAVIHGRNSREVDRIGFSFGQEYRQPGVTKDHLWLRCWSRDMLYPFSSDDKCGETEMECSEILESNRHCCGRLIVKKCGIRIVYDKDLEEMEQIKEPSSSPASASFDDNAGAIAKRKRNIYEEAGASVSEIAEETPKPKRLENFINFIMRKKH